MYDAAFPWKERKERKKDKRKPWLDGGGFKELVKARNELCSRKLRGRLGEGERQRLVDVTKEVNGTRQRLKRAYFDQRFLDIQGDLRATWEVLGEPL
jgi:hypothetical protein